MKRPEKKKGGRPSKGPLGRRITIAVKVSPVELELLDAKRGDAPAGVYLRDKGLAS